MPRAIGTTYEPDGKFLFPVKPLSKVFRAKYLAELSKKLEIDKATKESLFKKSWIVYAKRPFGSAKSVVEYLARYTHKNHRIQQLATALPIMKMTCEYSQKQKAGLPSDS